MSAPKTFRQRFFDGDSGASIPTPWVIPIVVAGVCSPVGAEVLNIRSEIRSEVRSFISGELDSSDLAIENFGETGLALPIQTVARLQTIDDADRLVAKAIGVADFRDPAVSVLSNTGGVRVRGVRHDGAFAVSLHCSPASRTTA